VFHVPLNKAVYRETRNGKLNLLDAAKCISDIQAEVHARWLHKGKEARLLMGLTRMKDTPRFGEEHEELLNWAIWNVVNYDA